MQTNLFTKSAAKRIYGWIRMDNENTIKTIEKQSKNRKLVILKEIIFYTSILSCISLMFFAFLLGRQRIFAEFEFLQTELKQCFLHTEEFMNNQVTILASMVVGWVVAYWLGLACGCYIGYRSHESVV